MRGTLTTLTPAWLAVTVFCALPLAHADDADSRFLGSMRAMGGTSDNAGLIEAAHTQR